MAEYIDRDILINDLIGLEKELFPDHKELGPFDLGILQGATFAITKTKSIPAADVQPVVHGKWEEVQEWMGDVEYSCSVCGCYAPWKELTTDQVCTEYCPHCGAKMDGDYNG